MTKTIEQQAGETILQRDETVSVGGVKYMVAPPSTATLILVSEAISTLPKVSLDDGQIVEESLAVARECRVLGDIVATLILGARKTSGRGLVGILRGRRRRRIARAVLEGLTPSELHALTAKLLGKMQIADFFALTTFLIETNLLRRTKVESETTAFGQ